MVEEGVAQCDELSDSRRGGDGRLDDLGFEDSTRLVDGGELEILLGPEVGVHAALAHVERAGEFADRESFESVKGGE